MKTNLLPIIACCIATTSTQSFAETNTSIASSAPIQLNQEYTSDTGAANRIGAADRLRTLSQEISAETCFLHNDVLPDHNHAALTNSTEEFDSILNALLNGDADRDIIGAEERIKTIREIEAITAEWEPIHQAIDAVLADPTNTTPVHLIYAESDHLLETTSHLLSELEAEYSHPAQVFMSDVMLIEFSGRQAMLTQKIAYDACLVWSGHGGQEQIDELKEVSQQFDLIAQAVQGGMPDAGLAAAPTDEIHQALEAVAADWSEVQVYLTNIIEVGATDTAEISWVDEALTSKMHQMEAIVDMYVAYSRRFVI